MTPRSPGPIWIDRLSRRMADARLTRRGLAGMTAGAALGAHRLPAAAALQSDPARRALDAIVTAEALLVTYLGAARELERELRMDDDLVRLVRVVQCEEDAHHNVLSAAGGVPATRSFTVLSRLDNGPTAFLRDWIAIETVQLGLYQAAARAFAVAGDPRLVEVAFQAGAVEAQHLATLRGLQGDRLPIDRAFAAWRYLDSSEAVDELADLGLIGGSGEETVYPGPRERFCRGVVGLVPETTDDQPSAARPNAEPGSPTVETTDDSDATPVAGDGAIRAGGALE